MKKSRAFTLIELLTVIVIIGLLITIMAVALNKSRVSARDTKRKEDIQQIATSVQLYYQDKQIYPVVTGSAWENPTASSTAMLLLTSGTSTYISSVPTDPWNVAAYHYDYCSDSTGSKYAVRARMEKSNGTTAMGSDYTCVSAAAYATKIYSWASVGPVVRYDYTSISSGY